jgi:hypothetical protein
MMGVYVSGKMSKLGGGHKVNPTYKVLSSFRNVVTEETHDDPSTLSTFDLNIKEDLMGDGGFTAKINAGERIEWVRKVRMDLASSLCTVLRSQSFYR